jgi:hypothetical protein
MTRAKVHDVHEQQEHHDVLTVHSYIQSQETQQRVMNLWRTIAFPPRYWFPNKRLPQSFLAFIPQQSHEKNLEIILSHYALDTSGSYFHVLGVLRIVTGGILAWCQFPTTRNLIPFIAIHYFYFTAGCSLVLLVTIFMKYWSRMRIDSKATKELPNIVSLLSIPGLKYEFRTQTKMGTRITTVVLHKSSMV